MDASEIESFVFDNARLGAFDDAERRGVEIILEMVLRVFPHHDAWQGILRGPARCVILGTRDAGRNKPVFAFYGPIASGRKVSFGLRFDDKTLRATLEGEQYRYDKRFELALTEEGREDLQRYLQWSAARPELAQRMGGLGLFESTSATSDDLMEIFASKDLGPTEREQLIAARIGQGKFRDDVLAQWGGRCAVTGSTVLEALRASHIVAWNKASKEEKRDPENGLPLIATLDALFDRHLVSFAEDGTLLLAEALRGKCEQLGITSEMRLQRLPSRKQKDYLATHRSIAGLG